MEVRNKRLLTLMISVSLVVLVRLFTLVPIDEDSSVSGLSSASKKEGALGLPVFEDSGARPIDPNAANRIGDGVDGRACPTWTAFNRQMLVDLHPNDNELVCEDLPQTTNFTIKLCKSKDHCGTGLFALQHRDPRYCANVLANERISPNRRLEQYYKTAFGPDAFQLLLDGPQRETPPLWSHKGDCLYTLPFRLINPGTYTASLIHAYESFEAFKEMGDFGLKVLYEPLFKDLKFDVCDSTKCPVWTAKRVEDLSPSLPLCSRYEPIQVAYLRMTFETEREIRKHAFHKFIYIGEPIGCRYDQRFELEDLVEQAKCHNNNKTILLHGDSHLRVSTQTFDARLSGYVGTKYNPKFEAIRAKYFPPNSKISRGAMKLTYFDEINRVLFRKSGKISAKYADTIPPRILLDMRPYGPEHDETPIDYPLADPTNPWHSKLWDPVAEKPIAPAAPAKKAVVIEEDIEGTSAEVALAEVTPAAPYDPTKVPILNNTEFWFEFKRYNEPLVYEHSHRGWDRVLLVNGVESMLYPYDTYLFNFGAWPMQTEKIGGHYTVERFKNALDYGADMLTRVNQFRAQRFNKSEVDIVWMGINAFPLLENQHHRKEDDWRTNYRHLVLTEYAERVMRRRGFKILNTFEGSLSWSQFTHDNSHFDRTPAMDSFVDEVLHKFNLCNR